MINDFHFPKTIIALNKINFKDEFLIFAWAEFQWINATEEGDNFKGIG